MQGATPARLGPLAPATGLGLRNAAAPVASDAALPAVGALVLLLALAGCGEDQQTVTRGAFADRLEERLSLDAEQSGCVTDLAFDAYDPETLQLIYDQGIQALPQTSWSGYVAALVACIYGREDP